MSPLTWLETYILAVVATTTGILWWQGITNAIHFLGL